MRRLLLTAAAALLATAAFSQPKSDLRPDRTVLLYAESADSLSDPVVGRAVEFAGFTISEDNGLRGPERIPSNGNIGNISSLARIDLYLPAQPGGQMVIVCPGGGNAIISSYNEGLYVAEWMLKKNIAVCVVKYRLPNGHWTVPLDDVQNAFRYCREHAEEWGVKQIGVMGFSAGGHLAACAETMYVDEMTRPDWAVLVYPVITFDRYTHSGTRKNLIGTETEPVVAFKDTTIGKEENTPPTLYQALIERYSTERCVTPATPPTFLVLCSDDNVVPPVNSILFYEALEACNVPREMYIYPTGGHGWGFTTSQYGKDRFNDYRAEFFTALSRFIDAQKQ